MKILVSIPTSPANPYIHKHVLRTALRLVQDKRYETVIMTPSHNPFENNLHHILNDFMDGDYDYWLNIDADNPPINNPLDLVEYDKDIIGLPTPVWHFDDANKPKGESPIYWNAYKSVPEKGAYTEWPIKEGIQRVDAVGTGCLLIARRVFENKEMRKAPFERELNEDGTVNKGNDISFCEKATKQGVEIWAHYGYPCLHFNELELNEVIKAFNNLYT